jgi:hypothetical protein
MGSFQTAMTKRESECLVKTLRHISRTRAGWSFKAPVEKLWPNCAAAYAAKIPNAIDLGTMEMKLKNDLYRSTTDFKADVALLYQNSVDFNGISHAVTSAAIEVRNAILNAVSEMEKGKTSTGASVEGF